MRAIYKQRLLKLADFIERTPVPNVKFDMTEYFDPRGLCGTAACIAGHAVIMKHTHGGRRKFQPSSQSIGLWVGAGCRVFLWLRLSTSA
jgi:hypothetical protein